MVINLSIYYILIIAFIPCTIRSSPCMHTEYDGHGCGAECIGVSESVNYISDDVKPSMNDMMELCSTSFRAR